MQIKTENHLEKYFVKEIEKLGGRCIKLACIGKMGFFDRTVWIAGSETIYVEFKSPSYPARLNPQQRKWHECAVSMGKRVYVINSKTRADALLKELSANIPTQS